jgi:hypothetical protein
VNHIWPSLELDSKVEKSGYCFAQESGCHWPTFRPPVSRNAEWHLFRRNWKMCPGHHETSYTALQWRRVCMPFWPAKKKKASVDHPLQAGDVADFSIAAFHHSATWSSGSSESPQMSPCLWVCPLQLKWSRVPELSVIRIGYTNSFHQVSGSFVQVTVRHLWLPRLLVSVAQALPSDPQGRNFCPVTF